MGRGRRILFIKASVVQWKDIHPWQPPSSFRVRRSSVGCSIARKGAAYLRMVQHSSEGRCLSRGCSVALTDQHSSDRVQRSSEGCSVVQKGAA